MKINCINCEHLEQIGRSEQQSRIPGRKKYFCKKQEKRYNFVCFGKYDFESTATIKTSPRWCPLKENEEE